MHSLWNLGRTVAVMFAALSLMTGIAQADTAYSHDATPGAGNTDWMAKVPGTKKLNELTLPGTHDSGASTTGGDMALTQSMSLRTQLDAGIRAWDIRLVNEYQHLTLWHGVTRQDLDFESDVMDVAEAFLAEHDQETIVMRIMEENVMFPDFDDAVGAVLNKYDNVYRSNAIPTLADVRGKIVVLQDFPSDAVYGIAWGALDKQDTYDLKDNWDLAYKWWQAKLQLNDAQNATDGKLYANFLSAAGGGFPYFFASGKSSPGTNAPQMLTAFTRSSLGNCEDNWKCIDEYPSVGCTHDDEVCSVAFKGMNALAMQELKDRSHPNHYGIIYADFPGRGLIRAIIDTNAAPAVVLQGLLSGRCADVPGASETSGTRLTLWDCHGRSNQRFTRDSGQLKIYGDKCLDLAGGSTIDGTPVAINDCDPSKISQKWTITPTGPIKNNKSHTCLEPAGVGTKNATKLIIWPCNETVNQRWLTQVDPLPR